MPHTPGVDRAKSLLPLNKDAAAASANPDTAAPETPEQGRQHPLPRRLLPEGSSSTTATPPAAAAAAVAAAAAAAGTRPFVPPLDLRGVGRSLQSAGPARDPFWAEQRAPMAGPPPAEGSDCSDEERCCELCLEPLLPLASTAAAAEAPLASAAGSSSGAQAGQPGCCGGEKGAASAGGRCAGDLDGTAGAAGASGGKRRRQEEGSKVWPRGAGSLAPHTPEQARQAPGSSSSRACSTPRQQPPDGAALGVEASWQPLARALPSWSLDKGQAAAAWEALPVDLLLLVYRSLPPHHHKRGRLVCRAWRSALSASVTKLTVGPHSLDPIPWYRQTQMMRRLPGLFPALQEIDFDQGVGADLMTLPQGLDTVPPVPRLSVTTSRTAAHAAAVRMLAARPSLRQLALRFPSDLRDEEVQRLVADVGAKLCSLDLQLAHLLTARGLGCLAAAAQLTALRLEAAPQLGAAAWAALAGLPRLRVLGLHARKGPVTAAQLALFSGLVDLRLKVRELDTQGAQALPSLTGLTTLQLEVWYIKNQAANPFLGTPFPQLEELQLEALSAGQAERVMEVLPQLPALTHLSLRLGRFCSDRLENAGRAMCLSQCRRLRSLWLAASPRGLGPLLGRCGALTALKLAEVGLADASERHRGTELPPLPRLCHLNLHKCPKVDDAGLAVIPTRFPQLTRLHLRADAVTDAGLAALAGARQLAVLTLTECKGLGGEGLRCLVHALPELEFITVVGNDPVLQAAREAAAEVARDVTVRRGLYPLEKELGIRPLSADLCI